MGVAGAYFLHRLGKGSGSGVDELLEPKHVNEEVFLETGVVVQLNLIKYIITQQIKVKPIHRSWKKLRITMVWT